MTGWTDHGESVELAAMSPRVLRLLAGFEASYRGACKHGGPQVAAATDLRSMCSTCAAASAAFTSWTSSGPCSACGALPDRPPLLVRMIPNPRTNTTVAVRLCSDCTSELQEPDERANR